MTAQVLATCGLNFGGPLLGPDEYNVRGYWEHQNVKHNVVRPMLKELGGDKIGQPPLPNPDKRLSNFKPEELRNEAYRHLRGANAYKDPKLVLVWPYFSQAFPNSRWILVRRDVNRIVDSILEAPWLNKLKSRGVCLRYVHDFLDRMKDMKQYLIYKEVWPTPDSPWMFRETIEFAGGVWDEERVRSTLNQELWHE